MSCRASSERLYYSLQYSVYSILIYELNFFICRTIYSLSDSAPTEWVFVAPHVFTSNIFCISLVEKKRRISSDWHMSTCYTHTHILHMMHTRCRLDLYKFYYILWFNTDTRTRTAYNRETFHDAKKWQLFVSMWKKKAAKPSRTQRISFYCIFIPQDREREREGERVTA